MPNEPSQQLPPSKGEAGRKSRLWIPGLIIAVAAVGVAAIQYCQIAELMPPSDTFLAKFVIIALSLILLFLWFVLLGPATRSLRTRVGAITVVVALGVLGTIRIENVSGNIWPKLRFRWTPHADETLARPSTEALDAAVNLSETTPEDYPEFLGPGRRAALDNVHLARDWSAQPPRKLWRQPIGAGWSSFAIVGHFAVTQEQRGEEELITCYDVDNGKLQWAQATPVRFSATIAGIGPRATPTIHEGKVYSMGAEGHLHCLDGATGKVIWMQNVVADNDAKVPQWGKSCSPLIYENMVIVSAGGPGGRSLVAYDKQTGKRIWGGGGDASSYSSPTLFNLGGQLQIVIVNEKVVTAHDPADGHILWHHPWPDSATASPNVAQPIAVGEDRVLLTKGYGIGSALCQIEHGADGWRVDQVWRTKNLKTKFTNAVVRDRFAYGLDEGILSCVEIATGKRRWKEGRYDHGQVLLVDDLLLVQSEKGDVALVEATPDAYRELTRFSAVSGQSWNCPALSGRRLLVRSEEEAACYELPLASP
ncbi:MAG: PQQ-like beta-propeller repeat protein [Planctomycetia bacterium]|nr:PQQ-like beta-propeller repeat protein [Planctomycetia bacterium]